MSDQDREFPFATDAASAHRGVDDDPVVTRSPFLPVGTTASGKWPVLAAPGFLHGLAQAQPIRSRRRCRLSPSRSPRRSPGRWRRWGACSVLGASPKRTPQAGKRWHEMR